MEQTADETSSERKKVFLQKKFTEVLYRGVAYTFINVKIYN